MHRTIALLFCSMLFAVPLAAQMVAEEAVVKPVRVDKPPKIDGFLDESLWKDIEPVTDFRQYEPDNGAPTTERTEVRICYDSRFLYFGVRAYDGEPGKIIARVFERDANVDEDDSFTIAIDSLNNNRTAVAFDTNVLGTQLDVQYSEDGLYNESWNAIWYSKGRIDELGYTLEIAIPFFVLRFKPADEVEMGLDLERIIRRKSEKVNWPYLSRDYDFIHVSRYGRMVGLKGIERGIDLEVKPYGIAGYSKIPGESDYEADAGLDVKWGLTSNLTADLTLNPDFAQVESDALKVNLTRFSLFYPEKRDFFIESSGLFQFGTPQSAEVFFSRRIGLRNGSEVPILGGARAYGMVGHTNIGLMTMQTRGSDGFGGENFSVARVKHNILGRSYVGGIFTSRRGEETFNDTTLGGDFMFLFGKNYKIQGSLSRSGVEAESGKGWMGNLSLSQYADLYDWIIRYEDIGNDFNPGMGFIQRPDQRGIMTNIHYKPRPGWKGVRQLYIGNVYRRIENHDGIVETRTIRPGFLMMFQTEDNFMTLYYDTYEMVPYSFPVAPGIAIPAGEYTNRQGLLTFDSSPARRLSVSATYTFGGFYGGDIQSAEYNFTFKPTERLHLIMGQAIDAVDLPSGSFNSVITTLLASFHFSPTLTTRVAAQYSSLYEDFVFNFRLRWIYAPGSEAWLVYDEGRRFGQAEPSLRDRAVILKVVYNLNF
jgi:hypothetical protein